MPEGYLSFSATAILQAVANGYGYGFDIMDATGLPSGTVYPALRRMEEAGLVASRWEDAAVAQKEQRPARKYYQLSKAGKLALAEAADRYRLTGRAPVRVGKPSTVR
jgi:PadR family transcriptional regulator, regulatory protein PadR